MKKIGALTDSAFGISLLAVVAIGCGVLVYTGSPFFTAPGDSLTAAVFPSTVVALTNSERLSENLGILSVDPLLNQAAQMKADDMVNNHYYAHVSPDGKSPLYWLNAVGYRYLNVGENLVVNVSNSNQAVTAWMGSPEHRDNILRSQFTQTGIGIATGMYNGHETTYVVQLFATPYPTRTVVATAAPVAKPVAVKAAITVATTTGSTPKRTLAQGVRAIATPIIDALQNTGTSTASTTELQPRVLALSIDQNPPIELGTVTPESPSITNAPLVGKGETITETSKVPSYTPKQVEVWFSIVTSEISTYINQKL